MAVLKVADSAAARDEALEWQLVASVYSQTLTLVVGALGIFLIALFGWFDTHRAGFLTWAAASMLLLAGRLFLERSYSLRREGPDRVAIWRGRFTIGAWAMGIMWGCAALVVVDGVPPFLQMITLSSVMVIVMGGAARNAGCPAAATGQILLGLTPTLLACALSRERYHLFFCLVIFFVGFAAFSLKHQIRERLVRLMLLNNENLALVDEIRRANIELSAAATTDALTGIANRRSFDGVLADEASRARRSHTDLSLLLLDIDSFKAFNDSYGHPAGDECLLLVARAFAATLKRPGDFVARYGGEEFVAVLPQTSLAAASKVAETVRKRIEAMKIAHRSGVARVVTVSIGVASFSADPHDGPQDLIRAADVALYAAKSAGRNCVRVAPAPAPAPAAARGAA